MYVSLPILQAEWPSQLPGDLPAEMSAAIGHRLPYDGHMPPATYWGRVFCVHTALPMRLWRNAAWNFPRFRVEPGSVDASQRRGYRLRRPKPAGTKAVDIDRVTPTGAS